MTREGYGLPENKFGTYTWEIRRRATRDEAFRALCEEHAEAWGAWEHFRAAGAPAERVQEYASLVEELQADILGALRGR